MFAIIYLLGIFIADLLKSRLEVENLSLPKTRHPIMVAEGQVPPDERNSKASARRMIETALRIKG